MTATLPGGWTGVDGWILRKNGGVDNREGVAITFWGPPHYVYGDACQWADSAIEAEPTVDFMADALAAQAMRDSVDAARAHRWPAPRHRASTVGPG